MKHIIIYLFALFGIFFFCLIPGVVNAQLADENSIVWGSNVFQDYDGIWHHKSDYNNSLIDMGAYWTTQTPAGISGRFYDDGRIYLGQDITHYVGLQPVGIYFVNYQNLTERTKLVDLTNSTLSVNDNVVTYTKGAVSIEFINSFETIKGNVYLPNSVPVTTESNPYLVVLWEVVGFKGIDVTDGEKSKWWFDNAKAAFPVGDIYNNGSKSLSKKIYRQDGKIYLAEGVGYNWISDVNRTDAQFIIDPVLQWNTTTAWSDWPGTLLEHGDNKLRAPPNVTTGLLYYWNPVTDINSGTTLTDIWDSKNGTMVGASWNVSGLYYDGNDYVSIPFFAKPASFTILSKINTSDTEGDIFSWGGSGTHTAEFRVYGGKLEYVEFDGTVTSVTSTALVNDGIEHDVGVVKNGTIVTLYIDGIVDGSGTVARTPSLATVQMGALRQDNGATISTYIIGTIGKTYFFNTVLSNDEINESMNNYHTFTSYRTLTTTQDAGVGEVWRYFDTDGTHVSSNVTAKLEVNGSSDNVTFNGWETVNSSFFISDNVSIGSAYQYQYARFRLTMNTTWQPETDIISAVTITSGAQSVFATDSLISGLNNTIESDGTITVNETATNGIDTNDTASSIGTSYITIPTYSSSDYIRRNLTITGDDLDWYNVANQTGWVRLHYANGTYIIDINGTSGNANFTDNISAGSYVITTIPSPYDHAPYSNYTAAASSWQSGMLWTAYYNDNQYQVYREYAGDDFNITYLFTSDLPAHEVEEYTLYIDGYYNGNPAHAMDVWVLNNLTGVYDYLGVMEYSTTEQAYIFYFQGIYQGEKYKNATNVTTIRLAHSVLESNNHYFYIDRIMLCVEPHSLLESYSPIDLTPTTIDGDNQTFNGTFIRPANGTWYIDGAIYSTFTNANNSSIELNNSTGNYNVTLWVWVNGVSYNEEYVTWDWTVYQPIQIPLSIFITLSVVMFIGVIIAFITTGPHGIISSFITVMIAYINSKSIINGSVVVYFGGISSTDTIVTGYRTIESQSLSYIFLFIALVMSIVFIMHVVNEIRYNLEPDMDGDFLDE